MKIKRTINSDLGRPSLEIYRNIEKQPYSIVLDNVRSMNNVGSIFRTCDAFAINTLFLCGITPKPPHRDIEKTALGATLSVNWTHMDSLNNCLEYLKSQNVELVSVEQTNKSIDIKNFSIQNQKKYAFIFGNEIDGVSDFALDYSNQFVSIHQLGIKHSLNIAVSVGIVLWKAFNDKI